MMVYLKSLTSTCFVISAFSFLCATYALSQETIDFHLCMQSQLKQFGYYGVKSSGTIKVRTENGLKHGVVSFNSFTYHGVSFVNQKPFKCSFEQPEAKRVNLTIEGLGDKEVPKGEELKVSQQYQYAYLVLEYLHIVCSYTNGVLQVPEEIQVANPESILPRSRFSKSIIDSDAIRKLTLVDETGETQLDALTAPPPPPMSPVVKVFGSISAMFLLS